MLTFVDDALPGITRRRFGKAWGYFDPEGNRITDRDEIDRLNRVGLPPAYKDAWFCPSPDGHIQATAIDEKGRKQYRYHTEFREQQEAHKYNKCGDFGRALPLIRARVDSDLAGNRLDHDRVIAAVVRLLDEGHVRVGNESYAQANNSYGATTLRNDHAAVRGATVRLHYVGKSGKEQKIRIEDRRLASIVRRCQDLPGQKLFQFVGSDGEPHPIGSGEVNAYLKEASGGDFTAKHFRTWGASVIAFQALVDAGHEGLKLKQMLEPVAAALGNTPAISRKSYVHPTLIELARSGDTSWLTDLKLPRPTRYLTRYERGLIAFLDASAEVPGPAGADAKAEIEERAEAA